MDLIDPLSKIIATAREAIGWNQSELARAVGVTPQAVQKWEAGTSVPRMQKMVEIAQALSIEHEKIVQAYGLLTAEQRLAAKIKGRPDERAEDHGLPAGLSVEEKRLLRLFRAIPETLREAAIAQIKALADLSSEKVNPVTAEKNGTIEHNPNEGHQRHQTAQKKGVDSLQLTGRGVDLDQAVSKAQRLFGVQRASGSSKKERQGGKS